MEYNLPTTAGVFAALIALAAIGLLAGGMMATTTILMMVLPSMIIFGLICLAIGVKHGEHRVRTH